MATKQLSTYERHIKSLTAAQKREFDKGFKEFIITEMVLAAAEHDHKGVKELAVMAELPPDLIDDMIKQIKKKQKKTSLK